MTQAFEDPPRYFPITESSMGYVSEAWRAWLAALVADGNRGISGTVTLAKITGGGTDGSLTFVNGRITAVVAPT
jgi:hypothetical protein